MRLNYNALGYRSCNTFRVWDTTFRIILLLAVCGSISNPSPRATTEARQHSSGKAIPDWTHPIFRLAKRKFRCAASRLRPSSTHRMGLGHCLEVLYGRRAAGASVLQDQMLKTLFRLRPIHWATLT